MSAIANAVGPTLGVERHCEPDLALAAGCGRALRQHNSCTVRECDGAVGGSLQPQIAAFFKSPNLAMFREIPFWGPVPAPIPFSESRTCDAQRQSIGGSLQPASLPSRPRWCRLWIPAVRDRSFLGFRVQM